MPDVFNRVIFGGEWELGDFSKGVDNVISGLKRVQDAQSQLVVENNQTTQSAKGAEEGIRKLAAQIAALDKTNKDYAATNQQLTSRLAELESKLSSYNKTIADQQEQLAGLQAMLSKMTASYENAKKAVDDMREATGKPIAPSMNDGKITGEIENVKKNVEAMTSTVSKKVQEARDKLALLVKTQEQYKNDIKEINNALKANQKEYNDTAKALQKLIDTEKGGTKEAAALREQMRGISANTKEFEAQLLTAKSGLANTTSAIKVQSVATKEAEKAGAGFSKSLTSAYGGLRKLAYLIPGVGIAGLVSMIAGPVIDAFTAFINKTTEAERALKMITDTVSGAGSAFQKAVVDVTTLKDEIQLAKEGFLDKDAVVKHYNETIGKTTGIVKSLDEAEQALVRNGQAYVQMTLYKAAANIALESAAKKAFEAAQIARQKDEDFENVADRSNNFNIRSEQDAKNAAEQIKRNEQERKNARIKAATDEQNSLLNIAADFNKAAATIAKAFNFNFFNDNKPDKITKARKEVENIYQQELQKLLSDLANINKSTFTNDDTITKAIEAQYNKAIAAIDKAVKDKKLNNKILVPELDIEGNDTGRKIGQVDDLKQKQRQLANLKELHDLDEFHKQKAAYLQQINDQLSTLQQEENLKRISLIQDNFERERQTIIAESDKTAEALSQKRDKTIADLLKNAAKNGLTEKDLQPQVEAIKKTYSDLLDDLDLIKIQKLQKLSFDTFEKLSEDAKRLLDSGNLGVSQSSLIKIQDTTAQYQAGKLSYASYQKALTQIARDEANERFQIERQFLEAEIAVRQAKLANDKSLTDDQITKLKDEIRKLQQQLTDATKGNLTSNTANGKSDGDAKIQEILAYANAIKSVTDGVISFWQTMNEQEQKALDRSIALQDRRVTAAQQVAAKGNADYLRMEEEKDQELILKKENAARRQMAINAAIQASQLLVAITGAVAKIAEPGVGAVDVIASIGVIVGSLAAGYALVKSLQQNQPSFYVGTEDTGHGGNVDSKGGFNAVLHPHERVLTAEENKQLKGISNKKLIETVQQHRGMVEQWKTKPAPQLNVAAMEMATNHSAKSEAIIMEGLERRMDENNILQKSIIRTLKGMGISVNMDRNGIAVSVLEATEEIVKNKKL